MSYRPEPTPNWRTPRPLTPPPTPVQQGHPLSACPGASQPSQTAHGQRITEDDAEHDVTQIPALASTDIGRRPDGHTEIKPHGYANYTEQNAFVSCNRVRWAFLLMGWCSPCEIAREQHPVSGAGILCCQRTEVKHTTSHGDVCHLFTLCTAARQEQAF